MRQATVEMVEPARAAIAMALLLPMDSFVLERLGVAIEEIKPGVRSKTVDWVAQMVYDVMYASRARGHTDLAEKLHSVVHALNDVVSDLEGS